MPQTNQEAHHCRLAAAYCAVLADRCDSWREARRRLYTRYPSTGPRFREYLREVFRKHHEFRVEYEKEAKTPESGANGSGANVASYDATRQGGS